MTAHCFKAPVIWGDLLHNNRQLTQEEKGGPERRREREGEV